MKKIEKPENHNRILARRLAKELTREDLHTVTGGTTSCSGGRADDCDIPQQ
jgi:hypothetical protein